MIFNASMWCSLQSKSSDESYCYLCQWGYAFAQLVFVSRITQTYFYEIVKRWALGKGTIGMILRRILIIVLKLLILTIFRPYIGGVTAFRAPANTVTTVTFSCHTCVSSLFSPRYFPASHIPSSCYVFLIYICLVTCLYGTPLLVLTCSVCAALISATVLSFWMWATSAVCQWYILWRSLSCHGTSQVCSTLTCSIYNCLRNSLSRLSLKATLAARLSKHWTIFA